MSKDIHGAYIRIARDKNWKLLADVKVFDTEQTSIVRVFQHTGGHYAVYASSSTDGKRATQAIEIAIAGVAECVKRVAASAGCVLKAGTDAAAQFA